MTENEFRRRPTGDRCGDDLRARLELVDEAMLAIVGNVVNGRVPGDKLERERCRLVAERIEAKGLHVGVLLARLPAVSPGMSQNAAPPEAPVGESIDELEARGVSVFQRILARSPDAAFEAERDAIIRAAAEREQGEEP
jgi:hypothetical protein